MPWNLLIPALASLVGMKYQSNIANDPKGPIGSGTSPSMNPGDASDFAPVQGSDVKEFADFSYEDVTKPNTEGSPEEEQLLQMLMEAGINPEDFGIMGLAFGGPLKRAGGGGIGSLLSMLDIELPEIIDPQEFITGPLETLGINAKDKINTKMQGLEAYAEANPEMFKALIDAGLITGKNLMNKPKEQKGSIVSTNTLPGNAARRRSQFDKITPLSGSEITFAKEGSALNRKMFMDNQMPNGGAMHGPGGPKDDLIPVMASNGEYMLSKAAVDAAGDGSHAMGIARLEKFNDMGNRRYG
tara:strand:- start:701 stop:1597 length:897 start_codon:yes stop_codon:yes gene_type:complete